MTTIVGEVIISLAKAAEGAILAAVYLVGGLSALSTEGKSRTAENRRTWVFPLSSCLAIPLFFTCNRSKPC